MKAETAKLLRAFVLAMTAVNAVQAEPSTPAAGNPVPVTADNFIRAESGSVFTGLAQQHHS